MSPNYALFKRLLLMLTAIILSQYSVIADSHLSVNQQLASPFTLPAPTYLDLAKHQLGTEQQSLYIMAAGRFIREGQWQAAVKVLARTESLTAEQIREKSLLLAKVDLMRQHAKSAIAKLASVHQLETMPLYYQVQYHEMLATAYREVGNGLESINERIKLEQLLPEELSRSNNRRALWLMLTTLPGEELNAFAVEADDGSPLDGWLQLAVIARTKSNDVAETLAQLQEWQRRYPSHPGNYILPTPLTQVEPLLFSSPRKIALLLPMTGKLSGPGNAIRDGFMAAYDAAPAVKKPSVQVYDTEQTSAAVLYQRALTEGADYVVGPLGKAEAAVVAGMNHPVPTLLLNDINQSIKPNGYWFGLSPVNEARQVAARARKNGYTRALIIRPSGAWGDEVSAAFTRQWHANGGLIVDTMVYGDESNIALAIKSLLHAEDEPPKRHQQHPQEKVSKKLKRRQDFDMIFLLAYPSKARQIMPMLKYYYAGDVPVYATSAVYSGSANPQKDRDLDGIIFCDMPWVFNHQMGYKNWPEQWNSYNRLYALGIDSYELSTQLNQLLLFPAIGADDESGVLYLTSNQHLARILAWGKIQQGLPHVMIDGV